VIESVEQHEIDRTGRRLLREAVEPLGWIVNEVQQDYGIDANVQVFANRSPTGAWFHIQLKSSRSTAYSANGSFISQELTTAHAKHYALEMHEPIFLIHADVNKKIVYWHAPQLDRSLAEVLGKTGAKYVAMRIPTAQRVPQTAADLLVALDRIYLVLANRQLIAAPNQEFAESIRHFANQEELYKAFQQKRDTIKLQKIADLFRERNLKDALPQAQTILMDPDSSIEVKFWARQQLEGIEFVSAAQGGKSGHDLAEITLNHAIAMQDLVEDAPRHMKFYALIVRKAAELLVQVQEDSDASMVLRQHDEGGASILMALALLAKKSAITNRIAMKYRQCLRLARLAKTYPDRWMLGRALTRIVQAIGRYIITLESEGNFEAAQAFAQSALQICKVSAWISIETGDGRGVGQAILSALMTTRSIDSDAFRWATEIASHLSDPEVKAEALIAIDRIVRRWSGEAQAGDLRADPVWQIFQNMASALGIDIRDEADPFVRALRIAAKDNSPERVLSQCEHIVESQGATGPIARQIQMLFNTSMASSKVIHCALHNYHVEGRELDAAYSEFKKSYCESCADSSPRPPGWCYTDREKSILQAKHRDFVEALVGTPYGLRYTEKD
jgi:hypothetical protein